MERSGLKGSHPGRDSERVPDRAKDWLPKKMANVEVPSSEGLVDH